MSYPFATITEGRSNLAKRHTAPLPVTLFQLPSLEALPTPLKDRARRAASQSHLPSLEDFSVKPQSIFQKIKSKRPQSSLAVMSPLLKSRRPSSPKRQASFFPFDFPAVVTTAFEFRPKVSRTNISRSSKNESVHSSLLPGESFTPFCTPSNTYSKSSLAAMPSIEHVMDTYDITHPMNFMYQEEQWKREKKEQKKKRRGTIKLPMMEPPPNGLNYSSKREELETLDGDDWEYGFPRNSSSSLTRAPTPSVPTHSHDHRQRNLSIPVMLDYTISIPPSRSRSRSRETIPRHFGSFEDDIGPFGTNRSHDIWLQNQVDTLEEVERGAVRELEQMNGRLMTDGWGYGNGNASSRANGRANRASQSELPAFHSPLLPESSTAPILTTELPTVQPPRRTSERNQIDNVSQREHSLTQESNGISVSPSRPVSEQHPHQKISDGHGGSASVKVEMGDKRRGSFSPYANANTNTNTNTSVSLPPAPPPPTGVPPPPPPVGGVCLPQQPPLYLAGTDKEVEQSSNTRGAKSTVGDNNRSKGSENDWPVNVTCKDLPNTKATLRLAEATFIAIAPPPIPPRSAERGYGEKKEIERTTSNPYLSTHPVAHAVGSLQLLQQQITSSGTSDSEHDKLASVNGQDETKEQKKELQTSPTVANRLSFGMLKPKRASTGGKKRGGSDILMAKRQDSSSSEQSQPIQKRSLLPPIHTQSSSPGTFVISKHHRRPSAAPVPAPTYFSSPGSTDSHCRAHPNSNPITPEKPHRLVPRDEPRHSLSPSSSAHAAESFSHDREREKIRQNLSAMGFLGLDEMHLRQSLALAQQPPTPPMPSSSKIASGAIGAAKGMVKGLMKARVSNAPSMVSESAFVVTPPKQKIKGHKREGTPQGKGRGVREEGNSMDFLVNESEGRDRPILAEALYIMPPAERSKIGSHKIDKERSRRQNSHAEMANQNGKGTKGDEGEGEYENENSISGSEEESNKEGETSIGAVSHLSHGKEGRKEEWCSAKENNSAKHLSLELAQENQARAMIASFPTSTATHTKARPAPIDVSLATINGWKREETEMGDFIPSLLPPPRPRKMAASGQRRAQSTESSQSRSLSPLNGVDERNTFFDLSRSSPTVSSDPACLPSVQSPTKAIAQDSFHFTPATTIHNSRYEIPRHPSNPASEHHQHSPQRQGRTHPFLPYPTPTTPKRRPHTSNSAHPSFTSPSLTPSPPSVASGSTADKEREEKERQRKLLMSAWLASKPMRRSEQEQVPAVLGRGAGEVRKRGRPWTSAGMGMKRDEDVRPAYMRASLDGRNV
ncbi:hypothetical protein D1P53_003503 [Cryptococcus gattii VGV]|nr:hypothetical protein D1P53_003503 [Cryptococcus gattii VGV]